MSEASTPPPAPCPRTRTAGASAAGSRCARAGPRGVGISRISSDTGPVCPGRSRASGYALAPMPPTPRPFPAFIADAPQDVAPYGRWGERLLEEVASAAEALADEAGAQCDREAVKWFPDRAWGGRVYVPLTARTKDAQGGPVEYFGHVSFVRSDDEEAEPAELRASADFTDVTADDNPDWRIDLNDEVIGRWRTDGDRGGDVTLVWGLPLVPGAVAATAEIDEEVLDQVAVVKGRFTLVAVDALHGFGEDLYLEVKLWDRQLREVAAESLYEEAEPQEAGSDVEEGER